MGLPLSVAFAVGALAGLMFFDSLVMPGALAACAVASYAFHVTTRRGKD